MTLPVSAFMEPDEFLAWERDQRERHAYFRGQIFAMAGGSPRHSLLASRTIELLGSRLRGKPCDVHTSDLRLALDARHCAYADAVVVCRPLELRLGTTDVVTNPSVVIDVLSKSTEAYDRGDKQAGFLALASLKHYILVSQRQARVELYTRQTDGSFRFTVHGPGATIELEELQVTLSVDDIYAGRAASSFPATTPESTRELVCLQHAYLRADTRHLESRVSARLRERRLRRRPRQRWSGNGRLEHRWER